MRLSIPWSCALLSLTLVLGLAACAGPQRAPGEARGEPGALTATEPPHFSAGQLPVYFVENAGQLDARVGYYVPGRAATLYFTPTGLTISLQDQRFGRELHVAQRSSPDRQSAPAVPGEADPPTRWSVAVDFVGANGNVRPQARDRAEAIVSYFKGAPVQWRTGLPTYTELVYEELWPGIDLVYSGTTGQLKYTFIVRPGADPSQIRMAYRGATSVELNEQGQIEISTPLGGFTDDAPYSYQDLRDGRRVEVASAYAIDLAAGPGFSTREGWDESAEGKSLTPEPVVGFEVGAYDPSSTLILDPAVLVYSGYLGGVGIDTANGVAVDTLGNAYVAGWTYSDQTTFPDAVGPDLSFNGTFDAFIAKVRADGTGLIYAGYIGGSGPDYGNGVAVDSSGNAYVVGETNSADFPVTTGPAVGLNSDAFIVKVNPTGTALAYGRVIGGDARDAAYGVAVDGEGTAYLAGLTKSTPSSLPVAVGPDLTFNGGANIGDAFVAKVNPAGSALVYLGYVGGAGEDVAYGMAIERGCPSNCAAYVAGQTSSPALADVPINGPYTTYRGGDLDAFVAKVRPDGTGLVYAGYIGGEGTDYAQGIATDAQGNAFVAGVTQSLPSSPQSPQGFPVVGNGFGTTFPGSFRAGFAASVNAAGTGLSYSGYLGGNGDTRANGIAVDGTGAAYVVGATNTGGPSFPQIDAPELTPGGDYDAFIAKIRPGGAGFDYVGFIGGAAFEEAYGVAVDGAGNPYVVGSTRSTNFPVRVFSGTIFNAGEQGKDASDAFVAKVSLTSGTLVPTPTVTATAIATPSRTPTATAGNTATPTPVPVSITDVSFQPQNVTINAGETVRWTNNGFATHTSTRGGTWDSGFLGNGQSFSFTFTSPGVFSYLCSIHFFQGTVTVLAPSGRGFTLQSGGPAPQSAGTRPQGAAQDRVLTWLPGQTSTLVVRWSPEHGFAVVRSLAPGATSTVDNTPATGVMICYVLLPYVGDLSNPQVQGVSDLLCVYPGTATLGSRVPGQFRIHLDEAQTARVDWSAVGDEHHFVLTGKRFNGASATATIAGGGQSYSGQSDPGPEATCLRVVAFDAASTDLGGTEMLCAVPGVARLGAAALPEAPSPGSAPMSLQVFPR